MAITVIDGVDYGPLAGLIGKWQGDKGMDIAPDPDLPREENPYYETIVFDALGTAGNANRQVLAVLFYRQMVSRKSDRNQFHDQCGYWTWDAKTGVVSHSLTIPRSMALLAGGEAKTRGTAVVIEVAASLGDPNWGVIQSPFLRDNASTKAFRMSLTIEADRLSYRQVTTLDIYGKPFEHTDENELTRNS
jgi:hypothetical protein